MFAAQTRHNRRYILKTDISRFYQSIYAHSVPWAIHGKPFAKSNRGLAHLGNRIDLLLRSAQDQQTIGVPIGPDTSLVVAEILLQASDRDLLQLIPDVRGHRYIDDYELGFRDRTDAENAYHVLGSVLSRYELALNPQKTEVVELPAQLESSWRVHLSRHEFVAASPRGQQTELLEYFSLSFELARRYTGEPVLQYAVARVRELKIEPSNWILFCTLLLDCAVPEPACLQYVLEIVIKNVNSGATCPTSELEEALNAILEEHSGTDHTSEIAWSVWACLALKIPIHGGAARKIETCENSVVALLALHANSEGLIQGGLNTAMWTASMTTQALYDESWLLAYEANVKGWLPSQGGGDHVAADPSFAFLKATSVSFYDPTAAVPVGTAPVPVPNVTSSINTGIQGALQSVGGSIASV